jgi:DNA-binding MarR family transcriptional regulator
MRQPLAQLKAAGSASRWTSERMKMARRTIPEATSSASVRKEADIATRRAAKSRDSEDPIDHVSGRWTFLTNHAHVLVMLAENPSMILRDVASAIGITERAVQKIIADLEGEGFIEREKVGRQNHYRINREGHLKHPAESHRTIGDLLRIFDDAASSTRAH